MSREIKFYVGLGNTRHLLICLPPGISFSSVDVQVQSYNRQIILTPHFSEDGYYAVTPYVVKGSPHKTAPLAIRVGKKIKNIRPFAQTWLSAHKMASGEWVIDIPKNLPAPIYRNGKKRIPLAKGAGKISSVAQVAKTIEDGKRSRENENTIPTLICFGGRIGDITVELPVSEALNLIRKY